MGWRRAVELARTADGLWCYSWWRHDGLLLVPIRADVGTNATRWQLQAPGEILDEFTTYAKTSPRFVGQTELARQLVDDLYPAPYISPVCVWICYQNALR